MAAVAQIMAELVREGGDEPGLVARHARIVGDDAVAAGGAGLDAEGAAGRGLALMAQEIGIAGVDRPVARAGAQLARPARHAGGGADMIEDFADAILAGRARQRKIVRRRRDQPAPAGRPEFGDQPFEGGELELELVGVDRQARSKRPDHDQSPPPFGLSFASA